MCKPTAPKCEIPQGLLDLLQDWVTQTPVSLRKRVAQLMARQIRRAVDATMATHDTSVGAMRDPLEANALLENLLLWAMPALLTSMRQTAVRPRSPSAPKGSND